MQKTHTHANKLNITRIRDLRLDQLTCNFGDGHFLEQYKLRVPHSSSPVGWRPVESSEWTGISPNLAESYEMNFIRLIISFIKCRLSAISGHRDGRKRGAHELCVRSLNASLNRRFKILNAPQIGSSNPFESK